MMKFLRLLKRIIKPAYIFIRKKNLFVLDFMDKVAGKKNKLIPPRSLLFVGDGDYLKIGDEFLSYFTELCDLKPEYRILDVGCGTGRMAIQLTKYLSNSGEYHGFDIVQDGIEWCKKNITQDYINFNFSHADIYNKTYNQNGSIKSSDYNFNYDSNYFDFVFLTSVFTHMLPDEIEQYLKEISRVMKKGSICLITFFILNKESFELMNAGLSSRNFKFQYDSNAFVIDEETPEHAIGFKDEYIQKIFSKNNLRITKIHLGSWCGRKEFLSYQDIVIACKR